MVFALVADRHHPAQAHLARGNPTNLPPNATYYAWYPAQCGRYRRRRRSSYQQGLACSESSSYHLHWGRRQVALRPPPGHRFCLCLLKQASARITAVCQCVSLLFFGLHHLVLVRQLEAILWSGRCGHTWLCALPCVDARLMLLCRGMVGTGPPAFGISALWTWRRALLRQVFG